MENDQFPNRDSAALQGLFKVGKEVRSLKKQLGKVKGDVESLGLIGLQKQLDRLNEHIITVSNDLIEVKRMLFRHELMLLRDYFRNIMHLTGHVSPPDTWAQAGQNCLGEILIYYAQTRERIEHCKETKAMEDAFDAFWKKTNEFLLKYGFPQMTKLD
jgi:hypothetical protein